mmetsp:Transcript_78960/g.223456  ORF Transcript_78960/g.223456 Transcript_78960/m.223456 type:complete len:211 (-) Transcript_78960:264-896(-)
MRRWCTASVPCGQFLIGDTPCAHSYQAGTCARSPLGHCRCGCHSGWNTGLALGWPVECSRRRHHRGATCHSRGLSRPGCVASEPGGGTGVARCDAAWRADCGRNRGDFGGGGAERVRPWQPESRCQGHSAAAWALDHPLPPHRRLVPDCFPGDLRSPRDPRRSRRPGALGVTGPRSGRQVPRRGAAGGGEDHRVAQRGGRGCAAGQGAFR